MSNAIEDRICHVYLKYTGRRPGDGIVIEEPSDIDGGDPEEIEVCGKPLQEYPDHPGWWYCPTCDRRPPAIPTPDPLKEREFPPDE